METDGTRAPAPGALALVQAFVNSIDVESGKEALRGPAELREWLAANGLAADDAPVHDAGLRRMLEVREALRALLEANNGAPLEPEAVEKLNRAGLDAALRLQFDRAGHADLLPAAAGVDGAIGRLLAIVYTAMTDGTWERLKACRCETCQWAFYDHSKNHSGAWCTMAVCGSRTKARAYRQRRRAEAAG